MAQKTTTVNLINEFSIFMEKIQVLETQLQNEINQTKEKQIEYNNLVKSLNEDKRASERLQIQLDTKIGEYNNKVSQLESKIQLNNETKRQLEEQKKKMDDAASSMSVERDELTKQQSNLKNRESFLEMEENRVKFLDRTLKALITDKDIKSKLQSIGIDT